jgi:hypothetical protein
MIRLLVAPDKGWGLPVCLSWNDYEDGIWAECQLETTRFDPFGISNLEIVVFPTFWTVTVA